MSKCPPPRHEFNLEISKRWVKSSGPRYVSIKISALDANAADEIRCMKLISKANPSHEGLSHIRTPIDVFNLQGECGTHTCLVFEPMRETLFQFQQRLPRQRLGPPIFKAYMFCLLQALDYLHTECRLIHTDIKDDNIMVTLEDDSVLKDLVQYYKTNSQPKHVRNEDGRVTYLSHDELGGLRGTTLLPRLADFNLCFPGLPDNRGHISPIQSHRYRAPEVFLGCPWSYSADIWNLGLMKILACSTGLLARTANTTRVHLAQMVSTLGNPPEALVQRERMCRKAKLGKIIISQKGKECETMNEFWGGPFFDEDGCIIRKDLVEEGKKLSDMVTELVGEEKEQFLDFAACMLQWLPEKRKTAKELLKHPFLDPLRIS
ncbi:Dual specificity protein kinase [Metarhizium brunneum]|uniref:Dual specificity protein kinase n=1 Tax=Metarhizium brunneum TaxID=500148 RepID=A0A7D5USD1_9HYPO|nr:Dual specificity protein kinase [Metarhizium brunneum]